MEQLATETSIPEKPAMGGLPLELLLMILDCLCTHHGPRPYPGSHLLKSRPESVERRNMDALAKLCRTSKLFNEIATPRLYHQIPGPNTEWKQIARTLITRPDLRRFIRHASITMIGSGAMIRSTWIGSTMIESTVIPPSPLHPEIVSYYERQVSNFPFGYLEHGYLDPLADWYPRGRPYSDKFQRAAQAVWMSLCGGPNLETLNYYPLARSGWPGPDGESVTESFGLCETGSMPSLTAIKIFCYESAGVHSNCLDTIFRVAPNITHLALAAHLRQHEWLPVTIASKFASVTRFTALDAWSLLRTPESLSESLAIFPNLEWLEIRLEHMASGETDLEWLEARLSLMAGGETGHGKGKADGLLKSIMTHSPKLKRFGASLECPQSPCNHQFNWLTDLVVMLENIGIHCEIGDFARAGWAE